MCTALSLNNKTKYLFGRNMDIEAPFGQQIVIVPRKYTIPMRFQKPLTLPSALIGMAFPYKDAENDNVLYPLFAEAANEDGLACAGLNFPGTAFYPEPSSIKGAYEITPYEVVPWVLGMFKTTKEVKAFLEKNNVQIVNKPVAKMLPLTPLHFIVADKNNESIVIEPCKDGLKVYDNPFGILTNNPTFDWQLLNLSFYQNIGTKQKKDVKWSGHTLAPFGQGFASVGLPGDWTPPSRFIRTAFLQSVTANNLEDEALVTQFFHILNNVAMVKGSIKVETPNGDHDDITLYSSCIDLNEGIYYYKSYYNNQIQVLNMHNENLDGKEVVCYPFALKQDFNFVNKK